MASVQTKPGTRKLSDVARKVVAPDGVTASGWPAVRDTCRTKLGVEFDDWQDGAGRLILAKRADGKLACTIGGVGISIPRQVGKTYLIGAMAFALCVNRPGMLVMWSAHHARTHGETFLAMQEFAARSKVKPYVKAVYVGSGDEEVRFHNGSRILFGARERGFGRGIPGVDMIVSDEAQIMSDKALDAQLATMNTSQFGLAIYVGTPPRPDDPSEAFTRMRNEAWEGTLRDAAWIEMGADPTADPGDRKQWVRANPSYPLRTPVESILRLQRKLKPDSFLREGLGVWVDTDAGAVIKAAPWAACANADAQIVGPVGVAWHVNPDRTHAAVAVVGALEDGSPGVEVVASTGYQDPDGKELVGIAWIERVVKSLAPGSVGVGADKWAKTGIDIDGVDVDEFSATDAILACGAFFDAVIAGELTHRDQPGLNAAVVGARKRTLQASWAWTPKDSSVDITPLVAATNALRVWQRAQSAPTFAPLVAYR